MEIRVVFAMANMVPMGLDIKLNGEKCRCNHIDIEIDDIGVSSDELSREVLSKLASKGVEFISKGKNNVLLVDMNTKSELGHKIVAAVSYIIPLQGETETITVWQDYPIDSGILGVFPITKRMPLGWLSDLSA